jgi:hypothetical protein
MNVDEIIAELKRSATEDKLPIEQMKTDAFYVACNYLIAYEENLFLLKDQDLRVYLMLITEDMTNG